jgi:hypothetical protein
MIRNFSGEIILAAKLNNLYAEPKEDQIAQLLEFRFGDGLVYLPRNYPKYLLSIAKQRGFVDPEGYLTRKGRALIVRHCMA